MAQTSSETGAIGQSMNAFADKIYERTGGKYKIEVYHNGQLGAEIDTIEGCQMGTIDIAVVNQSTLGNFIPDFPALDIPYLIISTDQVFLGEIGNYFLDELSGVQLYGLGIWESGFRNLTNSKADVNSVDDITGLKIRTMENQIHIAFWKALGADATPMAWGEAYTALQQGTVDGQENSILDSQSYSFQEVCPYWILTNHVYSANTIIMDKAYFESLPEDIQSALEEAAVYAGEQIGQEVLEREDAAKEELTAEGVTFVDVDNAAFTEHFSGYAEANFPDLADWCNQIRALAPNA